MNVFPAVGTIFSGAVTWSAEMQVILGTALALLALMLLVNMGMNWLGAKAAGMGRKKR